MRWNNAFIILLTVSIALAFETGGDYGFVSPVGHQLRISGSFAEYRTNHYHSGIDIKSSKGRIGDPLYSIHDGYISRIKIQSGGYGNVLFITHPNGFTSVYAHMEAFNDSIGEYIKALQYELHTFEVEVFLPKNKFKVTRGEQIGLMGTTGRSTGPHLHFELRDTKTDQPLNPFLYGIAPKDNIKPVAQNFAVYDLTDSNNPKRLTILPFSKNINGLYTFARTIEVESDQIGLGIQMYDQMNGAGNKNEVYACQVSLNDSLKFWWKADQFSFDETRYVNARLDYERKQTSNQKIQLLFLQECNDLSFVNNAKWDGIIRLTKNEVQAVKISAKDVSGNEIKVKLRFKKSSKPNDDSKFSKSHIPCDRDTILNYQSVKIELPKSTLYKAEKIDVAIKTTAINAKEYNSFEIGNAYLPAHKIYRTEFRLPYKSNRWCLIKKNKRGNWRSFGGVQKDSTLLCHLDEFGEFVLFEDEIKPTIETIRFSPNVNKYKEWRFVIKDNLNPDGILDDLVYAAYLDGEWVRLLYDKKNNLLRFVDMDLVKKHHDEFEIQVRDNVGNVTSRVYKLN